MERAYNILIVGGGIIGSSLAMALSEQGATDIGVVDCDLSGKWGSSERNAGGVRATWTERVNIALSIRSISFYESVAEAVGFQQKGYLWLYDAAAWPKTLKRIAFQNRHGVRVEPLSLRDITQRFPFLNRLEGVASATFSPNDGLINPNLLKEYYRSHAAPDRVDWIDHHAVESVAVAAGRVESVRLRTVSSEDDVERFLTAQALPDGGETASVKVGLLVNAAGAWAPQLACLYGRKIPSNPVRRQVAVIACQALDLSPYGMIVDTSGLYFHHEGGNILSGFSSPSETAGYRFAYEDSEFFLKEIWPRLIQRSSLFERLKQVGGWAGLYAVSPDRSAIIGPVSGMENLYEAHSFSGHGVMHSYAVGAVLAERILTGRYRTIDLSALSGNRFKAGPLLFEEMHI